VADQDTYLVLEDFGRLGCAWRETEADDADRETLIRGNSYGLVVSARSIRHASSWAFFLLLTFVKSAEARI